MAIRKIAQMGEPILRKEARAVTRDEIRSPAFQALVDDMIETMHDADGAGLAAPQVYEPLQVCVMELVENPRYPDLPHLPLTVLVNPVVEPLAFGGAVREARELQDSECVMMYEGCLSVTGIRGRVRRPRKVRVRALDRTGAPVEMLLEGPLASVVQHETDHLHGVLFIDRADPRTLTFLREFERHVPLAERVKDGGD